MSPKAPLLPQLQGTAVPDFVLERVVQMGRELEAAAGKNLISLTIYGGVARGRYREGQSDVNVAIVLEKDGADVLRAIAPIVRSAWSSVRVDAMILRKDEIPSAAKLFPTKFTDIAMHHVVVTGDDVFIGLDIPHDRLLYRIEQSLRNTALRLRRRLVLAGDQEPEAARAITSFVRPTAIDLAALLEAHGMSLPGEDRSAIVFSAAAKAFDLDGEALAQCADLRTGRQTVLTPSTLGARFVASIRKAADRAGKSQGGR